MKMWEAMDIINKKDKEYGFMVSFEHAGDGFLRSDHFPDKHASEKLIPTEEEAWELAHRFARQTKDKCVNIYVIDQNFSPVNGYKTRKIKNR